MSFVEFKINLIMLSIIYLVFISIFQFYNELSIKRLFAFIIEIQT